MKEKYPEILSADSTPGIISCNRIPRATYRLQFGLSFTFRDASELVPYLDDLGISDAYASPLLRPCHDESHGYDICAHDQLNPAIGSDQEFHAFSEALKRAGMGLLLDVVPNHMGISGPRNRWWMDVLENGASSTFADYFDIDWHPAKPELENKVLLPILEDQYGKVLESGKFQLALEEGAFFIRYYQNKLPVAPRTYSMILSHLLGRLYETLEKDHPHLQELQSILTAIGYLPARTELTPEKMEERSREKEVIKRRLAALYQQSPEIRAALNETVRIFNGAAGDPRSFDLLDRLLKDQAYRPAFWRVASDEINYRRFFDINSLAAIRMEAPEVFEEAHRLILRLLQEGMVTGLRIDHPDGLWNPAEYFQQLQQNFARRILEAPGETPAGTVEPGEGFPPAEKEKEAGGDRGPTGDRPLYVVAEKILCEGEKLPRDWAVSGTTGYEFLNLMNGLFVDPRNEKAFDRIYSQFIGASIPFANLVNSSKKMIMLVSLSSEIHALAHQLERIIENSRSYRDFTLNGLTFVLREIIAGLPVYRTYINETKQVTPRDQAYIQAAVEEAKRRNPRTAEAIFDFVGDTLLLRTLPDFPEEDQEKLIRFVMKFQQITGPVMAKGVEDTAFYIYNRLASLNEVGGHPGRFGASVAEFHEQNAERLKNWPHSLLASSTHDTKRGEDVRARLNVLSEIPGEWRLALSRWSRWNVSQKTLVDGELAPDRNDEYLLYQTLVGAWPASFSPEKDLSGFRDRIIAYMLKAIQEAKIHTSWVNPHEEYIAAVRKFVSAALSPGGKNRFFGHIQEFQKRIAYFGCWNSLGQSLLKLTSPGVPDIYQGSELWDFNLVDPDNRRAVDFGKSRRLLDSLRARIQREKPSLIPLARELVAAPRDPRIKLYVISQTLRYRRMHPDLFAAGDYFPLAGAGEKEDFFVAFMRRAAGRTAVVIVPRLIAGLTGGAEVPPTGEKVWKDTQIPLPPGDSADAYRNLFTGEEAPVEKEGAANFLPLGTVLRDFPVALLTPLVR